MRMQLYSQHMCVRDNIYVQCLIHEISVLSSWLLHPIHRRELSGKVQTIFRAVLDIVLKEFFDCVTERAFGKIDQISSRE